MTLDRIRTGDPTALASLLEREWAGLVAFLESRGSTAADAEDAAQEAFVRLWERREQWTDGSARGLVYRIALNLVSDGRRRRRVRRAWARTAAATPQDGPPTPEDDLLESEAVRRCRSALSRMAPRRRSVFQLVRERGFTYREAADALGLSPQTVANHMSLALRELRAELADVLPGSSTGSDADVDRKQHDG